MRCKVGDLAVIVKARGAENIGRLCEVVSFAYGDEDGPNWNTRLFSPSRRFDEWGQSATRPMLDGVSPDDWLRPIRDQPGQDETLSWKALPSPVEIIKELTK